MRVTLYKHSERKVEILTERPHTAKNGETPPAKRQRNGQMGKGTSESGKTDAGRVGILPDMMKRPESG